MMQSIRASISMLILFSILLGFAYPGFVTAVSDLLMRPQAEGSLVLSKEGKVIGSSLIGQSFSEPKYFWSRLSATGPVPYNAAVSSGSNLGSAAPNLEMAVKGRIKELKDAQPDNASRIPVDLVTASASGLDPHISPEAAAYQVQRVANVRHVSVEQIKDLVERYTEKRQFGILGEPRVNVLLLNNALDEIAAK